MGGGQQCSRTLLAESGPTAEPAGNLQYLYLSPLSIYIKLWKEGKRERKEGTETVEDREERKKEGEREEGDKGRE